MFTNDTAGWENVCVKDELGRSRYRYSNNYESRGKMKRKFLLLCVAFLLFTTLFVPAKSVQAADKAVPKVGEKISGFVVEKVKYDSATNATNIMFEHKKTGARLLVINNNDTNRGFSIKFNTPADNDEGTNHIIEHSVLAGSKKYHSNFLVTDLSNTTYVSFVNAFTSKNMTMFPICSKSEEQLLKSADIYLDAVFNPLMVTDRKIFEREAWRYELSALDGELTRNGIVYNEMQGNYGNIEMVAGFNAEKAIFPDSNQSNNSGGDPKAIPELTYEELKATYKKNYHPSNSFIVLYGDLDYKAFLKMIDKEYLSTYSKKYYSISRSTQKPFQKLVEKTYSFPVAKGSNTKKQAVIDLVFATEDIKKMGGQNFVELDTAISLLNMNNSPIKQAMAKSGIAESYNIELSTNSFQPTIHFIATKADETRKKDFYNLVMKELKLIVKNGLDTELVKSSLRYLDFQKAIGSTESSAFIGLSSANMKDVLFEDALIDYNSYRETIVKNLPKKELEKEIEKRIVNNTFAALTVTVPKAGLLEQQQKKLTKELAAKKASMSKKELTALIKRTEEIKAWNDEKTSDEVLKSLRAVSLKDLKVDVKKREVEQATVDKATVLTTTADVDSIGAAQFSFDISHLTAEELLYLQFYSQMISNGMPTSNRAEGQVLSEMAQKAYGLSNSVSVLYRDGKATGAYPAYSMSYYAFDTDFKDVFDLTADILLRTDLENTQTYGIRTASQIKAQYQQQFADPINFALVRSLAYTSLAYRYANYITGLDYYNFVIALEDKLASDPAAVAKKLAEVRTKAFNKGNLTVLFAGNTDTKMSFTASLTDFTKQLPDQTYEKAEVKLPVPDKREALATNTTVQYVGANSALAANGVPYSGKMDVINNILNSLMLVPEIRLKGGAYGAGAVADTDNYYVYTYRDSNFVNSLKVIGTTDEFLKSVTPYLTEDTLESYKLSAFATASPVTNELIDAIQTLIRQKNGFSAQFMIDYLSQIKDTTMADFETYAGYMEKLNQEMNYVVVADPATIEANKDLFDKVIYLQK